MTSTTSAIFLAFLLFILGAATGNALSELPNGLILLLPLGAEIWLLGGAMVKVLRE